MTALRVEHREGGYPWRVVITAGRSAGWSPVPGFKLKREAVSWVAEHVDAPWEALYPTCVAAAAAHDDLIVTVGRSELWGLLRRLTHLEAELSAARTVLLQVNGSAMALADARTAQGEDWEPAWTAEGWRARQVRPAGIARPNVNVTPAEDTAPL